MLRTLKKKKLRSGVYTLTLVVSVFKFKAVSILLLSVVVPTLGCSLLELRLTPSRLPTAVWLLVCICVCVCLRSGVLAYVHVCMFVDSSSSVLLRDRLPRCDVPSLFLLIQRWYAAVPPPRPACQGKAAVATPEETRVMFIYYINKYSGRLL